MKDFEVLIKLIIPAILLIFWALSNLFNRDQKNNPVRDRSGSPLGPRPGTGPRPQDRLSGTSTMNPPRTTSARDDEVLIIRAEPNRAGARAAQPQQRRNQGRPRNNAPQPRRPEPSTQASKNRDLIGARISSDVNQLITKPIEVRNLTAGEAAAAPMASASVATDTQRNFRALDLQAVLASPTRIREAFILNEILQPPVSMRKKA